jgi:hypothetical protein
MSAGDNWYQKMLAVRKRIDHNCPCGKKLRHRGSCRFRQEYLMAKDKAPDENRTADCTKDGGERTEKAPDGCPSSGLSGAALERHQASLPDFVQVGGLVGGKRRGRKAAEDHDEATEEAAAKTSQYTRAPSCRRRA